MTRDERRAVQALLREALTHAHLPGATAEHPGSLPLDVVPLPDPLARFTAELTTLGGFVHEAATADDVARIVAGLIPADEPRTALMWDDRWLPIAGVAEALERVGVKVERQDPGNFGSGVPGLRGSEVPGSGVRGSADRREILASASVGITGADACLPATGSIVVASGPGRGRLASLLPPVHVALVTRRLFVESLPVLLATRPDLVTVGANLVCITGPSRTADIELTLSRGVHGPREVHAVFLPDA
jgi:L-lactate dehydrogenase complex protein LldG